MTYDSPSTINASKGIGEVLNYTNTVTDNWMATMFLLAVYVITYISFYRGSNDIKGSFAVAGFVTFILGLLAWMGGFVSTVIFAYSVGAVILGIALLLLDQN